MLLFIEGYPYSLNDIVKDGLTVRDVLKDVVSVPVKEDKYSFGYVGYCYSKTAKDVVFFLPKVVLTGEINEDSGDDTIFGASPQEIIDFEFRKGKDQVYRRRVQGIQGVPVHSFDLDIPDNKRI